MKRCASCIPGWDERGRALTSCAGNLFLKIVVFSVMPSFFASSGLRKTTGLSILTLLCLALQGCTSGPTVSRNQVNVLRNVRTGVVMDVRPVVIEGENTYIGTGAGGAAGAVAAGSQIGRGTGSALAGVAGGTLGAIAGREVEEMLTRQDGFEITIQLDNGQLVSVIQPEDVYYPQIGDAVLVTGGEVRLNPNFN